MLIVQRVDSKFLWWNPTTTEIAVFYISLQWQYCRPAFQMSFTERGQTKTVSPAKQNAVCNQLFETLSKKKIVKVIHIWLSICIPVFKMADWIMHENVAAIKAYFLRCSCRHKMHNLWHSSFWGWHCLRRLHVAPIHLSWRIRPEFQFRIPYRGPEIAKISQDFAKYLRAHSRQSSILTQ